MFQKVGLKRTLAAETGRGIVSGNGNGNGWDGNDGGDGWVGRARTPESWLVEIYETGHCCVVLWWRDVRCKIQGWMGLIK